MDTSDMPAQAARAERFRALHTGPAPLVTPTAWDAGSARMLAALGFAALETTSAGLSFSLGRPDGEGGVSRDETIARLREVVAATGLPVTADLENGFGRDPETVAETVRLAARAGAVAASIEDGSGDPADPILDAGLAAERIAAAVAAARALPFPFMLTARAENFLFGRRDLADTIARLQAFEAAGADAVYPTAVADMASIRAIRAAVRGPLVILAGLTADSPTVAELAAAGVARVSPGSGLARAALGGLIRAARELRETGTFGYAAEALPYAEANRMMREG